MWMSSLEPSDMGCELLKKREMRREEKRMRGSQRKKAVKVSWS